MPRPLDTRLDRVEGQRMAAAVEPDAATIRPALRAEAAMAAVIRSALARAGGRRRGCDPPLFCRGSRRAAGGDPRHRRIAARRGDRRTARQRR
jgi:hypothetical protein